MNILTTGGTGLLGTQIQALLPQHNWINANYPEVDITNEQQFTTWFKKNISEADHFLHLAAYTDPIAAEKQAGDKHGLCYLLNVTATQTIVNVCQEHNLPLLYMSTAYVYDGTQLDFYTEADAPNPPGWYGHTKLLGEQLIQKAGLQYTITRIDHPYGDYFSEKPDWVHTIKQKLDQGTLYPMFNDKWITPVWIRDIAAACEKIFTHPAANTIFNLATDAETTLYEAAQMIAERTGYDPKSIKPGKLTKYFQQNPLATKIYLQHLRLSNKKFTNAYAFKFHDLTQGLDAIFT